MGRQSRRKREARSGGGAPASAWPPEAVPGSADVIVAALDRLFTEPDRPPALVQVAPADLTQSTGLGIDEVVAGMGRWDERPGCSIPLLSFITRFSAEQRRRLLGERQPAIMDWDDRAKAERLGEAPDAIIDRRLFRLLEAHRLVGDPADFSGPIDGWLGPDDDGVACAIALLPHRDQKVMAARFGLDGRGVKDLPQLRCLFPESSLEFVGHLDHFLLSVTRGRLPAGDEFMPDNARARAVVGAVSAASAGRATGGLLSGFNFFEPNGSGIAPAEHEEDVDRTVSGARTPLGLCLTGREESQWMRQTPNGFFLCVPNADSEWMRLASQWLRPEQLLAESNGRFGSVAPIVREPGDVVELRYRYAAGAFCQAVRGFNDAIDEADEERFEQSEGHQHGRVMSQAAVELLCRSQPHYLPPGAVEAILSSEPPSADLADEIRLPAEVVLVTFGVPVELQRRSAWWPSALVDAIDRHVPAAAVETACARSVGKQLLSVEAAPGVPPLAALVHLGGSIEGVVLLAGEDQRLADEIMWLIAVPYEGRTVARVVVPANLSRATMAPQILNLAAVLGWGDWIDPIRKATPPTEAEAASLAGRGALRRDRPRGSLIGVRILDTKRMASRRRASGPPTGRSVSSHVRRAHWHRFRTGSREGWAGSYAVHWVPPLLVNPGAEITSQVTRVWRLPEPPGNAGETAEGLR